MKRKIIAMYPLPSSMNQTEMKSIQLKRKLLALNGVIEAARAGTAGIEFAEELNEMEDLSLDYLNQSPSHHD